MTIPFQRLRLLPVAAVLLLAGCNTVVMNPSGHIAAQQSDLIVISTVLMLLIIVPVIALTLWFAWHYRQANASATYDPEWSHSTQLELLIWAAPLLIIVALGAVTWISTHLLDPYRPLDQIGTDRPVPGGEPLQIQVVALDWKWLFIYPKQGIALVNEVAAPVDQPIQFTISASSVMNSFYIPALAGQIYAMPAMETTLHAVINKVGEYDGFSANYSGAGFSHMRFKFHGMSTGDFNQWVDKVKAGGGELSRTAYLQLVKPSEQDPVRGFAKVAPDLFSAIVNRCVAPGEVCLDKQMKGDLRRNARAFALRETLTASLGSGRTPWSLDANRDLPPSLYELRYSGPACTASNEPLVPTELRASLANSVRN